MKIVCLIKSAPPLFYFANRINSKHKIALTIVEKPSLSPSNIIQKVKKNGVAMSLFILRNRILRKKNKVLDYNKYFGDQWHKIDSTIPCLETENINSDVVYERLRTIKPDLIIDHGTSLVKDHILETSELALNLHWGLSPYYRGTHCTEWALINWDPKNIGVTIHKLTKEIDGGSILAQARADIQPTDTLHSINMQLTYRGTELMLKAIDKISKGDKNLHFAKQDFSLGYLTFIRQWNYLLDREIEYIEKNNLIGLMLKKPSRQVELPIVVME